MVPEVLTKIFYKLILVLLLMFLVFVTKDVCASNDAEYKIYCNSTLEDDFSCDSVIVVLKQDASYTFKQYSKYDFLDVGCIGVEELTKTDTYIIQNDLHNDLVNVDEYRRILLLELKNKSKKNVLETIEILIEREDVLYAGPNYTVTLMSAQPNDIFYDEQWVIDSINLPQA